MAISVKAVAKATAKATLHGFAKALNYRVAYAPKALVAGFRFAEDVRLIIQTDSPVCFDIGANRGQTIELLQRTFRNPWIHAFEPAHQSFSALELRNYGPRVTLNQLAMGAHACQLEFTNYENPLLSSFLRLGNATENRFRSVKAEATEVVEVATVDSYVRDRGIQRINLLKIDTQGYDLQVLRGAEGCLKAGLIDAVFVELNFVRMYEGQADPNEITAFLAGHNVRLVDYYEKFREGNILAWCTALYARA